MKQRFLQPRVTPVSLDAEKPTGYEDPRYAQQRARSFKWLRFGGELEGEYIKQSRSLWVRRAFALGLLGVSTFVGLTHSWTAQWLVMAVCTALGWVALYIAAWHSRHEFLLRGELQQQAQVDGLTGALNRRAFRQHLDVVWRQAEREGVMVGLMLLDLDHFKELNDQHGHQAGDVVLRATSQILKSYALRPLDAVGRYGGDEFVVTWYDANPESFSQLVQLLPSKLWMGLAATDVRKADITCSGGAVLVRPTSKLSIENVIRAADEELYRVKRSNRGVIGLGAEVLQASAQKGGEAARLRDAANQ